MEPENGLHYRLRSLEQRIQRIEKLEPAVIRSQVADMKQDIENLGRDMRAMSVAFNESVDAIRKILIGFLITFAFTGITTVVAIVSLTGRP